MSSNLCAIISDNLDASIKQQLESVCSNIMTQSEVDEAENITHQKLLARIEEQKKKGDTMILSAIKGRAFEIHGAKQLQDGRVQVAIAVNLTVLFDIQGVRTDLETNEQFEAMYRYARGLLYVAPTHKDGSPNPLFNSVANYAQDIAKNPKASFQPNGSLDLRASGRGANLFQLVAQAMNDTGYIIFGVSKVDIQIGDGTSYQLKSVYLNDVTMTPKTGVVNVIELDESLRFVKASAPMPQTTNRLTQPVDMVLPTPVSKAPAEHMNNVPHTASSTTQGSTGNTVPRPVQRLNIDSIT